MPTARRSIRIFSTVGILLLAGWASPLWAKPGMVKTLDDLSYDGDLDESNATDVIVTNKGIKTKISRRNIKQILHFDTPRQEYDAKLAKLSARDAAGRVALAQWAIDGKHYDLAREALASAKQLDPKNVQADGLLQRIEKEAPAPPPPASQPAVPQPPKLVKGARLPVVKRPVTLEEVNQVRQSEWRADDRTVKTRVPPDVRTKFIQSGTMPIPDANKLNPTQLAMTILESGPPTLRKDVLVLNDPKPMAYFRTHVQKVLSTGCANCHAPEKAAAAGNFVLFPGDTEQATYSNFLTLQRVTKVVDNQEFSMVDRSRPQSSLLLTYLQPSDQANPPGTGHPAGQYKGIVRNALDQRYKDVQEWISSLSPLLRQSYDSIDLSKGEGKIEPKMPK